MKFFRRLLVLSLVFLSLVLLAGANLKPSDNPPPASPTLTPAPTSSLYTFAVISDIHSDLKSLQKALDKARDDGIGFIVAAGDLTTVGGTAEFKKVRAILDKSNIPYYVIPGNHDLWSKGGVANFVEVFGPDFQSFQKGKVKFILINNGDGLRGLEERQQNWLDQELVDCLKLYCLVFAHMPLNHPYLTHVMGEDSPAVAGQAVELVRQLADYQVKKLFAGHIHYFSSYELGGLGTHTDGAIYSDSSTVAPRFLEVTVSNSKILEEKEVWVE